MLKQHFKAIREYAEKMTSGRKAEPDNSPRTAEPKAMSFHQQLSQGLYAPLSQLVKNNVGWSYRDVPVMIYKQPTEINRIHFASDCDLLKNDHDWVWVSSSRNNISSSEYQWCEYCLALAGINSNGDHHNDDSLFTDFVKRNSHYYFNAQSSHQQSFHQQSLHEQNIKCWSPGQSIATPAAYLLEHEPLQEHEHSQEHSPEKKHHPCQHCTWQLPEDSAYLFNKNSTENSPHYCILCAQNYTESIVIIPEQLRWQALQQRYHYFNNVCQNWAHLRLHIDISWHPLINRLQQKGIEMPTPYHHFYQGQRLILLAPLAWVDKKRAVVASKDELYGIEDDWNIITYTELLNSLG